MGDLSDKLEDGLAQFAALDEELDAALKEMGLPGLAAAADDENSLSQLPDVMRLCTILPLSARHSALREALKNGANPNERCPWGAMALDTLYADGDAVGLSILLDFDADATDYGWNDAHLAVTRQDSTALNALSEQTLRAKDQIGDTPCVLACRLGLPELANALFWDEDAQDAAFVTASAGSVAVMQVLVDMGVDLNCTAADGNTLLLQAVEAGQVAMVSFLLGRGARLDAVRSVSVAQPFAGRSEKLQSVLDKMMSAVADLMPGPSAPHRTTIYDAAYDPAIVRILVAHGADAAKFQDELFPVAIGVDQRPAVSISRDEFAAQYRVRLGRRNPEPVVVPFWFEQIRTGHSAYHAKTQIVGDDVDTDGPVWSFNRFGRTATRLPDGRLVLIGGEHEDFYDPDFCIYNDVTLIGPDNAITHYTYPVDVFAPTGFHTATLHEDGIWIIGNHGYAQHRQAGMTQVLWLSLTDFSIHSIATMGQSPGWIHGHEAVLHNGAIHVRGGHVHHADKPLSGRFVLDLKTRKWHAVN